MWGQGGSSIASCNAHNTLTAILDINVQSDGGGGDGGGGCGCSLLALCDAHTAILVISVQSDGGGGDGGGVCGYSSLALCDAHNSWLYWLSVYKVIVGVGGCWGWGGVHFTCSVWCM